jgi:hypothetical protein
MSSLDNVFDEAEADVERGEPWKFREDDAPDPLTIQVTGWSTGRTALGEAEFMQGVDRSGKAWSVLVGSVVLRKALIEGLVEEWDDALRKYVVTDTLGRVQVGEVVSIKWTGEKQGEKYAYPTFRISRRRAAVIPEDAGPPDDDIGF